MPWGRSTGVPWVTDVSIGSRTLRPAIAPKEPPPCPESYARARSHWCRIVLFAVMVHRGGPAGHGRAGDSQPPRAVATDGVADRTAALKEAGGRHGRTHRHGPSPRRRPRRPRADGHDHHDDDGSAPSAPAPRRSCPAPAPAPPPHRAAAPAPAAGCRRPRRPIRAWCRRSARPRPGVAAPRWPTCRPTPPRVHARMPRLCRGS